MFLKKNLLKIIKTFFIKNKDKDIYNKFYGIGFEPLYIPKKIVKKNK